VVFVIPVDRISQNLDVTGPLLIWRCAQVHHVDRCEKRQSCDRACLGLPGGCGRTRQSRHGGSSPTRRSWPGTTPPRPDDEDFRREASTASLQKAIASYQRFSASFVQVDAKILIVRARRGDPTSQHRTSWSAQSFQRWPGKSQYRLAP
jgi:hypothetical protein